VWSPGKRPAGLCAPPVAALSVVGKLRQSAVVFSPRRGPLGE